MIEQFSVRGRDLLRTAVLIEGQEVPLVFIGGQWVRDDNGNSLDPSLARDLESVGYPSEDDYSDEEEE